MNDTEIFVYISLGETNHFVGRLWCHDRNGRERASFEYDKAWLKHPERFALEPALTLTEGAFHTQVDQRLFGAMGDSAPDRWGRVLMRRAETTRAKEAGETARTLREVDFLLGVNDESRQGALRFSKEMGGAFLSPKGKKTIPPLVNLPRLLSATERFLDHEEDNEDLRLLLAPGSSLGGARPKASIRDQENQISIAKFPRKDDEFNLVGWEAVVLRLADKSGIRIPDWHYERISDKPVLIMRRFDRTPNGERIPFLSALSMLGAKDGEEHSYLEIVDALRRHGAMPQADMAELWRRIVFNILISNTDDHLRNHAFIYEREKGWRLSPAYDMNPTPIEIKPRILTTAIDLHDRTASLDLALSVARDFRLSLDQAKEIIKEVWQGVAQWKEVSRTFGLQREIDRMASAFEHEDAHKANNM